MQCKNCEIPISQNQRYCFDCGARIIKNRLTLKALFQQVNVEFFSVDNKLLKTFNHLFTKPESVIVSYINGTRKKYINVIQYFAIALTLLGIQVFFMEHIFNNPELYKLVFLEELAKSPGQENNPFLNGNIDDFNSTQSIFFTIGIPFSAFATWITFRMTGIKRFNFTEHVVINLYYGAHTVIVSAFLYVAALGFGINFFTAAFYIIILTYAYFFFVLKRVSNTSFWITFANVIISLFIIGAIFVFISILGAIIGFIVKLILN
ncbi:DUF3667 domain-containing protein [Winogradskyella haliclonae]|uniref:DUF3667 domain-containing protein n=1 Tax=Winogradskyella haliclonae TaxID=2048558 RepID=A0ABQ2C0D3_9FLAO|nr:DUF3667 domain-containing protein [Winogradskyella haliclonae]GGI58195.1 hypothetical protein GCM10011444_25040 [Winogradskyella haliclonae]